MVEVKKKGFVMVAKRDTDWGIPEFIKLEKKDMLNAVYKGFTTILAQLDLDVIIKFFEKEELTDEDFDYLKKEIVKNAVLF